MLTTSLLDIVCCYVLYRLLLGSALFTYTSTILYIYASQYLHHGEDYVSS